MRRAAALTLLWFTLIACSRTPRAYVRMRNVGTQPVREVEMNYGVMFGVSELKAGEMRERYVPLNAAADLELRFYDASKQLHTSKGPHIGYHQSGLIEAQIGAKGDVKWNVTLKD
jgi:hypothetical protein